MLLVIYLIFPWLIINLLFCTYKSQSRRLIFGVWISFGSALRREGWAG